MQRLFIKIHSNVSSLKFLATFLHQNSFFFNLGWQKSTGRFRNFSQLLTKKNYQTYPPKTLLIAYSAVASSVLPRLRRRVRVLNNICPIDLIKLPSIS